MAISEADIRRFWAKVDIRGPDACWPWLGAPTSAGYGRMKISGKEFKAHRIAYLLHHGIDPGELNVCHTCDYPLCCNSAHLFRGTHADNVADCCRKGRNATGDRHGSRTHPENRPRGAQHGSHTHPEKWARGDRNGNSKLTAKEISKIRERFAAGGVSYTDLAREFGVTGSNIGYIIRNKTWPELSA